LLNVGLLLPMDVIEKAVDYAGKNQISPTGQAII
jgi:hypothetical protein